MWRALSRPFGAAAGLLTAVLALLAGAHADGLDGGALTGSRADLVATARTGIGGATAAVALLLVVGTLLATDRLEPLRRSELKAAVLVPTALGIALALPAAAALTWPVARAADLRVFPAPGIALAWAGEAIVLTVAAARLAGTGASPPPR